jgi:hypothetical protein
MPKRFAPVLAASLLCTAAVGARAQPASPQAGDAGPSNTVASVTVNAAKPKVVQRQARGFVQGHADIPNREVGQIGRWYDPVCVEVVGLPRPDQAAAIKARVESVARALGLPATRAGCRANVEIVFSDQPQQVMDAVARSREYLLGYYHRNRRDQLKSVTRPIQAWYVTATQDEGHGAPALTFSGLARYAQPRAEVLDDPGNAPPGGCADSRLASACLKSVFRNVFMVADSKALGGKDLGLTADYMAMLALSQPRSLDGCEALPSVIDVFARSACPGRAPPNGLTPSDAAYLTALYAADLEARTAGEQSEIARRMAAILVKAGRDGREANGGLGPAG